MTQSTTEEGSKKGKKRGIKKESQRPTLIEGFGISKALNFNSREVEKKEREDGLKTHFILGMVFEFETEVTEGKSYLSRDLKESFQCNEASRNLSGKRYHPVFQYMIGKSKAS